MSKYEIVHVEEKYRYMTFMEKSTMFENVKDEQDLSEAFTSMYPDHIVLSTIMVTI